MKLSATEKKILMLAMDTVASDGEIAAAASRFFHSLRKRYKNGIDLIKAMESWDEVQQPIPTPNPFQQYQPGAGVNPFAGGVSFTRPFGAPPPPGPQPQAPPPRYQQEANAWQDLMREAQRQAEAFRQRMYQQHMASAQAAAAAGASRAQANAHAETAEHQAWAREQLKKKPPGFWKNLFGAVIDDE